MDDNNFICCKHYKQQEIYSFGIPITYGEKINIFNFFLVHFAIGFILIKKAKNKTLFFLNLLTLINPKKNINKLILSKFLVFFRIVFSTQIKFFVIVRKSRKITIIISSQYRSMNFHLTANMVIFGLVRVFHTCLQYNISKHTLSSRISIVFIQSKVLFHTYVFCIRVPAKRKSRHTAA